MLITSATEKALIHFALTYLIEQFDEDLLERFRESHITVELSEQLEGKDSMAQVEWIVKRIENLKTKIYHQPSPNDQLSNAFQLANDDQLELVDGLLVLKPVTTPLPSETFVNLVREERIQKIINSFEID